MTLPRRTENLRAPRSMALEISLSKPSPGRPSRNSSQADHPTEMGRTATKSRPSSSSTESPKKSSKP